MGEMPADGISDWLETMYNRDDALKQLSHETLRLEAEADVDRLLG
jgi:sporulation-control protein spo0M